MSIQFRNKEGKVNDRSSNIGYEGGIRDDIILDVDGVKEIIATYYQQQYGHDTPPHVTVTILDPEGEMLVEVEFVEYEYPIPF
jgi:hypothetical protein